METSGPSVQHSVLTTTCFCLTLARPWRAGICNSLVISISSKSPLNMKLAGCRSPQLAQIQGFPGCWQAVCRAQGWGKVSALRLCLEQMAPGDASLSHPALWHSIKLGFVSKIELFRGDSPDFEPTCWCSQSVCLNALMSDFFGYIQTYVNSGWGWYKAEKATMGQPQPQSSWGASHKTEDPISVSTFSTDAQTLHEV